MTFLLKFKKVLLHRLRAGKPFYYGAVYEFLTDAPDAKVKSGSAR